MLAHVHSASQFDGPAREELQQVAAQFCSYQSIALELIKTKQRKESRFQLFMQVRSWPSFRLLSSPLKFSQVSHISIKTGRARSLELAPGPQLQAPLALLSTGEDNANSLHPSAPSLMPPLPKH